MQWQGDDTTVSISQRGKKVDKHEQYSKRRAISHQAAFRYFWSFVTRHMIIIDSRASWRIQKHIKLQT
jgi:hypothetical protein